MRSTRSWMRSNICMSFTLINRSLGNEMSIKHSIRKLLWSVGYDLSRFIPANNDIARRKQMLGFYGVDTVIDVGANTGQYSLELRHDIGYTSRIISFEPMSLAFSVLSERSAKDANWDIFNFALGDTASTAEINIAGNSYSSSLLGMLPSHLSSAPESAYTGKEVVVIKTLDEIFDGLNIHGKNIYMKIDTQGFESKVLNGAVKSLAKIDTIQMEMSLVPLYEGELLFVDMCKLMSEKGYTLVSIAGGFTDPKSGQLLQADGIFRR